MKKRIKCVITLLLSMSVICGLATVGAASPGVWAAAANVKAMGARGNGVTDDTAAIQNALAQYDNIYIPDGTYLINVDISLKPKSKQTIVLANGAVLKAIPTANENSAVIKLDGVSGVTISGGSIIGERYKHKGATGQWGIGIFVGNGSSDIDISNLKISECWGDGIYIGGDYKAENIQIDNVISYNNKRHGMGITYASNVTVSNSVFKNSDGDGIDVETNKGTTTESISFINIECYGNSFYGLSLAGFNGTTKDISLTDSYLHNNGEYGLSIVTVSKLRCENTVFSNNKVGIKVLKDLSDAQFNGITVKNNAMYGILICGDEQENGIDGIIILDSHIYNNSQRNINTYDGVRVFNDDTGFLKNISFIGCKFYDDQAKPTQRYGVNVSEASKISNIIVTEDCGFSGNLTGGYYGNIQLSGS